MNRKWIWWTVGALALILAAGGATYLLLPKPAPLPQRATQACEQFVKDQLKSPATAAFSNEQASLIGDLWTVRGAVDSQNGFGALVRSGFVCNVRQDGPGWRSYGVTFNQS